MINSNPISSKERTVLVLVRAAALAGGCANCVRGFYSKEDTCSERAAAKLGVHIHTNTVQFKESLSGKGKVSRGEGFVRRGSEKG